MLLRCQCYTTHTRKKNSQFFFSLLFCPFFIASNYWFCCCCCCYCGSFSFFLCSLSLSLSPLAPFPFYCNLKSDNNSTCKTVQCTLHQIKKKKVNTHVSISKIEITKHENIFSKEFYN